jgi:hypothetical protein
MEPAEVDEAVRRRFEAAWIAHRPISIQECLPAAGSPAWLATLEELVLIELEFGWKSKRIGGPIVEDYLACFPELRKPEILLRLVEQEFAVRQAHGDRPSREPYRKRFPTVILTGDELRGGKPLPLDSAPLGLAEATERNAATGLPMSPPAVSVRSPSAADANLLFAVIAFQMEYLDTGQFAAACRAWGTGKSRLLADLLVERGWITMQAQEELAGVVERKLKRCGGDPHAALGAAADDAVRDAMRSIDEPRVQELLASLIPAAGHVMLETIAHQPPERSRYTLTRLHAEGGLGRVWIARDGDLNRDVALKELKSSPADHPEAWRRFLKEAQVTGQLEHPNIVPVYELGRRGEDNQPFYTMRFVRGQTLREAAADFHRGRRDGKDDPVEWLRLLQVFVSICNAVSYAHSRGAIHRDLKPENVILGDFGEVLVLDWGLAKTSDSKDESLPPIDVSKTAASFRTTVSGRILGTPAYMAPEQAEGRIDLVDDRTDVYGLGAILFEILTGRPPHLRGDTTDIIRQIVRDPTPLPRSVNPAVPRSLEAICVHAMARQRTQRYPAAEELARDVQRYLADEPVSVYRESQVARIGRFVRRHRTKVAVAAAMTLVTLISSGIGLFVWIESRNRAMQETEARMGRLKTSVVADQTLALNELKQGNYSPVDDLLDRAANRMANKPDVDARPEMVELRNQITAQHERLHKISQFYKLVNEAQRLEFFEYDDRAEDTCTAAIDLFGALDDPNWWEHLPADDLAVAQHDRLQEEVFRQLLFLAALRAKRGLIHLDDPQNSAAYRSALVAIDAANRWKLSESARLLAVYCRLRLGLGEIAKLGQSKPIEPTCAADYYFLGILYYWVSQMQDDAASVFLKMSQPLTGVDLFDPLAQSEHLLLHAASVNSQHYWTYFWLGWNRLADKQFSGAELAFDTCIALHPSDALGYAYRGWSLVLESRATDNAGIQAKLRQRGLNDLAHARSIEPTTPEFAWLNGQALASSGQTREALQSFERAAELEPPLETWAGRRVRTEKQSELTQMFDIAKAATDKDPRNLDGWTALATAAWALGKLDDADRAARQALGLRADQPVALAVRGSVAFKRQKFDAALADFHAALDQQNKLWLAAYGLAQATESQGTPAQALGQFDAIAEIAETDWQKVEAQLGRSRIFARLNRTDEAAEALKAAQAVDPRAGKGK